VQGVRDPAQGNEPVQAVFDESVSLTGSLLIETNELLHEVYQS
jgi:hypothetical protein